MVRYETLILAIPEITRDESATLERDFDKVVKKNRGSLISYERWGKYRLAYPVRKNDYGVYFLIRYEIDKRDSDLVSDLETLFKLKKGDIVMRSMTSNLPLDKSLMYTKPEALDETPTRDVDSFLRKNKMEGLLSTVSSVKEKAPSPQPETPITEFVKVSEEVSVEAPQPEVKDVEKLIPVEELKETDEE